MIKTVRHKLSAVQRQMSAPQQQLQQETVHRKIFSHVSCICDWACLSRMMDKDSKPRLERRSDHKPDSTLSPSLYKLETESQRATGTLFIFILSALVSSLIIFEGKVSHLPTTSDWYVPLVWPHLMYTGTRYDLMYVKCSVSLSKRCWRQSSHDTDPIHNSTAHN